MVEKVENVGLVKREGTDLTKFSDFTSVEEVKKFGDSILKSDLCPKHIQSSGDVLIAVLTGKELGFGVMASLRNIHPINGMPTIGVHIKTSLLLKAGVIFKVIKDYQPLRTYVDRIGNVYGEEYITKNLDKIQVITSTTPSQLLDKEKTHVLVKSIDYITTIHFLRKKQDAEGHWHTLEHTQHFKYSEAKKAKLVIEGGQWEKYPQRMMFARCLSFGAAIIADDIQQGIYETSELLEAKGINYKANEDLTEFEIIDEKGGEQAQVEDSNLETTVAEEVKVEEPTAVEDNLGS